MADKSLDKGSSGEDIRYDHKWGFTDTYFKVNPDHTVTVTGSRYALSGTVMHEFLPFVEEMLDIKIDFDNLKLRSKTSPSPHPGSMKAFTRPSKPSYLPRSSPRMIGSA